MTPILRAGDNTQTENREEAHHPLGRHKDRSLRLALLMQKYIGCLWQGPKKWWA